MAPSLGLSFSILPGDRQGIGDAPGKVGGPRPQVRGRQSPRQTRQVWAAPQTPAGSCSKGRGSRAVRKGIVTRETVGHSLSTRRRWEGPVASRRPTLTHTLAAGPGPRCPSCRGPAAPGGHTAPCEALTSPSIWSPACFTVVGRTSPLRAYSGCHCSLRWDVSSLGTDAVLLSAHSLCFATCPHTVGAL